MLPSRFSLFPMEQAKELRDSGLSAEEIGKELAWEQRVGQAYLTQLASPNGVVEDATDENRRAEWHALLEEREELVRRLGVVEAALAKSQNDLASTIVAGKSRQTYLKIAYLVARDSGYDPNRNNSAVSDIRNRFAAEDIAAEDDEAIRNVLKEAMARKFGGYWKPKPQKDG